jgi:hypothetical protein
MAEHHPVLNLADIAFGYSVAAFNLDIPLGEAFLMADAFHIIGQIFFCALPDIHVREASISPA